jgi:hypothetical protein
MCGRFACQSPPTVICSFIIHSAARWSCGWFGGSPDSTSALAARAVSHTGETQGWK